MLQRERSPMPRRGFLGGLATLPAATITGAALARPEAVGGRRLSGDAADIDTLWVTWLRAKGRNQAACKAWRATDTLLPWWVRPGPSRLYADGSIGGPECGWPAIQGLQPPTDGGTFRSIRPSQYDIVEQHDTMVRFWGDKIVKQAAETRDRRLDELREREAAAQIERERVGEPALSSAADEAADDMFAAEDAFLVLEPTSPAVAAARLMSRAVFNCRERDTIEDDAAAEIAAVALRGFLPMLAGEIAVDAAEFIGDPMRPIGDMRIWRGIEPASLA